MKILVTGAAGFIGSKICHLLALRGDEVVGLDCINDYYDVRLKAGRLRELGISADQQCDLPWHELIPSTLHNNFRFVRMGIEQKEALDALFAADVRVEMDDRSEKFGYKMREAQIEKVPYIVVVGKNEAEAGEISFRLHGEKETTTVKFDEFIEKVTTEIKTKAH